MKRKAYVLYAGLAIASLGLLTLFYWAFTGSEALEVTKTTITPKTVKAGENVMVKVQYCKFTDDVGRSARRLVGDKREIVLPVIPDEFKKGCHSQEIPLPIPDDTSPGFYTPRYRITYNTNPLHTNVIGEFSGEEIEVIK
jgi:hypothetical protein